MIRFFTPSELVVPYGVNFDTLVHLSLFTVFNPVLIWVFVWKFGISWFLAGLVDVLWLIRGLNLILRSCEGRVGKVIAITGGTSGLGYQIVKQLIQRNEVEKIIVIDHAHRNEFDKLEKVQFVKFDFSNGLTGLNLDLANVDVLVCNAGMRQLNELCALPQVEITRIIQTNWISHMTLITQFITARATNPFQVITIGSVLGYVGPKKLGVYGGTKNALVSMMDSLRVEHPSGVFTLVLPGQLNSQMFADVEVNEFWAPVIDIVKLGLKVVTMMEHRIDGDFAYPLYGRLLPIYRVLPYFLQKWCRWYSGMDNV